MQKMRLEPISKSFLAVRAAVVQRRHSRTNSRIFGNIVFPTLVQAPVKTESKPLFNFEIGSSLLHH
jgi:hypothetical protein